MKQIMRCKNLYFTVPGIALLLFFTVPLLTNAEIFQSSSFRILDPVISSGAERSTSTSFVLLHALGEFALGTSTATSFQLNPGFLTFPTVTLPTVTATAGDAQISLSWTAASGALGWTVGGYNVGQSTTSGGPYTYTSLGNVTSSTRTGLTNGTQFFFVIRPEDAFGNSIATSTEVSATPVAAEPEPEPTPAPSGGGGGGGGGIVAPAVLKGSIVLQGSAYPGALVIILLDEKIIKQVSIGGEARFSQFFSAESGTHSVGVFAEDKEGRRSLTFTFSVVVLGTSETTVSGIVLPPTVALDAQATSPRTLLVSGASFPQAIVSLTFNSFHELIRETSVNDAGTWDFRLDTFLLEEGDHLVRAKTILEDTRESIFSESRTFTVLPEGLQIVRKKVALCGIADFNCEGRVNLIDFSILLFNFGIPEDFKTDLNGDGKVNIIDFSILLFYWTG